MSQLDNASNELTLNMPEPELIMWDGAGTAHILARGNGNEYMSPRTSAITRALLLLALEEIENAESTHLTAALACRPMDAGATP